MTAQVDRRKLIAAAGVAAASALLGKGAAIAQAAGPAGHGAPWTYSAGDLAALIARKEVSCVETVEAHLRRIEAVNPKVNAIVKVFAEKARRDAAAADQKIAAGDELGPLHGVPFTIKENIDSRAPRRLTGSARSPTTSCPSTHPSSSGCAPPARSRSAARICPTSACVPKRTPLCMD